MSSESLRQYMHSEIHKIPVAVMERVLTRVNYIYNIITKNRKRFWLLYYFYFFLIIIMKIINDITSLCREYFIKYPSNTKRNIKPARRELELLVDPKDRKKIEKIYYKSAELSTERKTKSNPNWSWWDKYSWVYNIDRVIYWNNSWNLWRKNREFHNSKWCYYKKMWVNETVKHMRNS